MISRTSALAIALATATVMLPAAGSMAAGQIAGWDFSAITASGGNWGTSPMPTITQDTNLDVVGLTRNWTLGAGTAAAFAWGGNNFDITATTEAAAIASNDFTTFVLTPKPGYSLSVNSIEAYNIRHSATGPQTGIWQYAVGAGSYTDIGSAIAWGGVTTSAGNPEAAIDLSSVPALQNVPAGTPVAIRLVTWGATSTGGTWYFNEPTSHTTVADVAVDGAVTAVPEPAALSLFAFGALGLLARRRRQA